MTKDEKLDIINDLYGRLGDIDDQLSDVMTLYTRGVEKLGAKEAKTWAATARHSLKQIQNRIWRTIKSLTREDPL